MRAVSAAFLPPRHFPFGVAVDQMPHGTTLDLAADDQARGRSLPVEISRVFVPPCIGADVSPRQLRLSDQHISAMPEP